MNSFSKYADAYYNLGKAYQELADKYPQQGYVKLAVRNLQTYLQLAPNAPDREQVQQLIDQLEQPQG